MHRIGFSEHLQDSRTKGYVLAHIDDTIKTSIKNKHNYALGDNVGSWHRTALVDTRYAGACPERDYV
jgi:hypothetical protein